MLPSQVRSAHRAERTRGLTLPSRHMAGGTADMVDRLCPTS
jgi:hypothetical protein